MAIRFRYALHVETDLIHVWPSKAARTHDIGFESDCWRDGWRPLPSSCLACGDSALQGGEETSLPPFTNRSGLM